MRQSGVVRFDLMCCAVVWYGVERRGCGVVWCGVVLCGVMKSCAGSCIVVRSGVVWCDVERCGDV